jgi:hypothetical protein
MSKDKFNTKLLFKNEEVQNEGNFTSCTRKLEKDPFNCIFFLTHRNGTGSFSETKLMFLPIAVE